MSEWARPSDDSGELQVFATGTTTLVASHDGSPTIIALRRGVTVPDFHARPGHRPGTRITATSARAGGDTDVVRPVLIDPAFACDLALSGALFAEPVPGLVIEGDGADPGTRRYLAWQAVLTGDGIRRTPVTINLLASPSMVVTVLEMVPQRRIRWNRDAFVREAVAAVETLARRLERANGARPAGRRDARRTAVGCSGSAPRRALASRGPGR